MYLKITSREQKYGGFLLNCTKIPLTSYFVLKVSAVGVDLKIVISSIASQEKENKVLCIANEEMSATTFNS